jgi:hypothetical protein
MHPTRACPTGIIKLKCNTKASKFNGGRVLIALKEETVRSNVAVDDVVIVAVTYRL